MLQAMLLQHQMTNLLPPALKAVQDPVRVDFLQAGHALTLLVHIHLPIPPLDLC